MKSSFAHFFLKCILVGSFLSDIYFSLKFSTFFSRDFSIFPVFLIFPPQMCEISRTWFFASGEFHEYYSDRTPPYTHISIVSQTLEIMEKIALRCELTLALFGVRRITCEDPACTDCKTASKLWIPERVWVYRQRRGFCLAGTSPPIYSGIYATVSFMYAMVKIWSSKKKKKKRRKKKSLLSVAIFFRGD